MKKSEILTGVRVLVVEDDDDSRSLFSLLLETHGAVAVDSVDDALLEVEDFLPDVLVSDLAMPRRDGYALIHELRRRGCRVPAVAVTARDDKRGHQLALMSGFQAYVGKPFAIDHFVTLVASFAGGQAWPELAATPILGRHR